MFEEEFEKINYKIYYLEKRISKMEICLEVRNLKYRGKNCFNYEFVKMNLCMEQMLYGSIVLIIMYLIM